MTLGQLGEFNNYLNLMHLHVFSFHLISYKRWEINIYQCMVFTNWTICQLLLLTSRLNYAMALELQRHFKSLHFFFTELNKMHIFYLILLNNSKISLIYEMKTVF